MDSYRGRLKNITSRSAVSFFIVIALSYVINAMDRQVFAQFVKDINQEFHLTLAQGGFLATSFALGMGLTGIFAGYLIDRWSRRNAAILGIFIYSIFTILVPLSAGFWDMGLYRTITGIGEALQQTAIYTIVGAYFSRNRSIGFGGLNVAYGLGGFVGPNLGTFIYLWSGNSWRMSLYIFGLLGLLYCIIMSKLPKSFTEFNEEYDKEHVEDNIPTNWLNMNVILLSISSILVGLYNFSYNGLYPTFLKNVLHYSPEQAAFAASMYGLGAFMGLPAGWLGEKFKQKNVVLFAVVGQLIVGYFMWEVAKSPWQQDFLSFLVGTFGSGFLFVNMYALTQRSVRKKNIGKASGIASSSHYIVAAFSGYIFGGLVQLTNWSTAAFFIMVITPIITLICISLVRMDKTYLNIKLSKGISS